MQFRRILLLGSMIALCLALMPRPAAALGMGFGARAGIVFDYDNPKLDSQGIAPKDLSMLGGQITLFGLGQLSVEGSIEYAAKSYTREIVSPDVGGIDATTVAADFSVRDYGGFLTGRFKIVQGIFGVHLGGGLSIHRFTYKVDLPHEVSWFDDVVEVPDNKWHSGIHGLVGVSLGPPMSPIRVFGEVRVVKISVDGDAGQQATALIGLTFGSF